jgi:isopenicillin-N epimerase
MPQTISWGEEGEDPGPTQFLMDFQWQGTRDMSAFLSIPSAINFVKKNKWRENHIASKEIIIETSQILSELLKTEPLFIGNDWVGQMVSHRLPNNLPETLKNNLWKDFLIEVPIFEWQNQKFIRVSVHYYNDRSDIKRLISALKKLLF